MPHSDPVVRRAYMREYYARHREHLREIQNAATASRSLSKSRKTLAERKASRRYGWKAHGIIDFTTDQYEKMYADQEERCAICCMHISLYGSGRSNLDACVDHDKDTGRVRGLLCRRCNLGIGFLGDSLNGIHAAERFLMEEYGGITSGCM